MIAAYAGLVEPAYYHHSHLTGLQPDTAYRVVFASDDSASREFHFRTAPAADGKDSALLYGGDSRIGGSELYDHADRQEMNQRMAMPFERTPTSTRSRAAATTARWPSGATLIAG